MWVMVIYVLIGDAPHLFGTQRYMSKLECTVSRTRVTAELGAYSKDVLIECARVGKA